MLSSAGVMISLPPPEVPIHPVLIVVTCPRRTDCWCGMVLCTVGFELVLTSYCASQQLRFQF